MKEYSIIAQEVRRTNRNFIIIMGIIIFITVSNFISARDSLYNYLGGPFRGDEGVVAALPKANLQATETVESGTETGEGELTEEEELQIDKRIFYDYAFATQGMENTALRFGKHTFFVTLEEKAAYELPDFTRYKDFTYIRYILLPVGDGYLLAETTPGHVQDDRFSGVVLPMTESLRNDVAKAIPEAYRNQIYEMVYYTAGSFQNYFFYDMIFLAVLLLLSCILAYRFIQRIVRPLRHPIYKKLAMFGDPEEVAEQIDAEFLLKEAKMYKNEAVTKTFRLRKKLLTTRVSKNEQFDPWDEAAMERRRKRD